MIKVFLAEDEYLVREGLRDNIPWSEYGFEFAGEAGDGEMALPLIRKIKPDLLITDIKMPFMDGLALARIVAKELPQTRIIILSGYDDFTFAQQAIELHVDQYLLKPITKAAMIEVLNTVKESFDRDREQKDYMQKFARESREYEQYARRKFFEELVTGTLSVNEIYDKAGKLGLDLNAETYNVVLFTLSSPVLGNTYSDGGSDFEDELVQSFFGRQEYIVFRWNLMGYAVLIRADENSIREVTSECLRIIEERCAAATVQVEWYASVGTPVRRLGGIAGCFAEANTCLSYRHLYPKQHIFRGGETYGMDSTEELAHINSIDIEMVDPMVLRNFLRTGTESEIVPFVNGFLSNLKTAANSVMFRQYILLSTRFNAALAVKEFGGDQDRFMSQLPEFNPDMGFEATREYITDIFTKALELRENVSKNQYHQMMKTAVEYIDSHFTDDGLSLNSVAKTVNVSANYFSAVFSQEMGQTFVEYVTRKRMDKARELLRRSSMRSGEIAFEVGYRDPRYFSFIFKKTTGFTPRDYRAQGSSNTMKREP